MNILQVHNRYREAGGEDAVVSAERRLLEEAGHQVFPYEVDNPSSLAPTAGALLIAPWNPLSLRDIRQKAQAAEADVAHVHNFWYTLSPSVLRGLKQAGLPTVLTLHNYRLACVNALLTRKGAPCVDCVGKTPWRGVTRRCYRDSAALSGAVAAMIVVNRAHQTWTRYVDMFIALSQFGVDIFEQSGVPAGRVVVRDNVTHDPGPRPEPPSASTKVVVVGRVSSEKGVGFLLDVWNSAQTGDLELLVVGDGPQREALAAREIPGVSFLGHQDREFVDDLLLSSRCMILPTRVYENQPMSVLEAFAAGLPVLASDVPPVRSTLRGVEEHWMRNPLDAAAWIDGLESLTDDEMVDAGSRRAREMYERRFRPDVGLATLEEVYHRALQLEPA